MAGLNGIPYEQIWALAPVVTALIVGLVVLLLDLVLKDDQRDTILPVAGHGLVLTAFVAWFARTHPAVRHALGGAPGTAGGIDLDRYALGMTILACVAGLMCLWMAPQYLKRRHIQEGPFAALWVLAVSGMIVMVQAADLLVLLVGLEIMSISFYILAGLDAHDARSPESALKYFLNGTFASGVMIYGIVLVYGATGTIAFRSLASALMDLGGSGTGSFALLARVGLGLILGGFFFKVGAVPFHMWAPDVYEGAPTPVTAFLATGVKVAAFGGLTRLLYLGFPGFYEVWAPLIWGVAALTMVVGNMAAMVQESLKRLLAFSSVAHAGYLLVALISVDPKHASWSGGEALVFYLVAYTFSTVGAFAVLSWTGREQESLEQLVDYKGLSRTHPWMAFMLTFFMLALAGMPPTAGFTGKYFIFTAAVKAGYADLAVIGVLSSVMSVYYYLKVIVFMYFHEPDPEAPFVYTGSPTTTATIWVAAIGVLYLGLCPTRFLHYASVAMSALF